MSVGVFYVRLADISRALLTHYEGWLTPDERAKSDRMAADDLRAEHIVTRALCRWVLSQNEPSVRPEAWRFDRTEAGRPFAIGPRAVPSFSLSHAGGVVVCALCAEPVGVDVEPLSRGDELVVTAAKMFSPAENEALALLPENERPRRAVELWTAKEAYLKARGEGISVRLTRFGLVSVGGGRYRLGDVDVLGDDPLKWQVESHGVVEQSLIAVAVRRGRRPDLPVELEAVVPS